MANTIYNKIHCETTDVMDIIKNKFFTDGKFDFEKVTPEGEDYHKSWGAATQYDKYGQCEVWKDGKSFEFYTQWTSPLNLMSSMSKQLDNKPFTIEFCDTDNYTPLIKMKWQNGKIIEQSYANYDFDNGCFGKFQKMEIDPTFAADNSDVAKFKAERREAAKQQDSKESRTVNDADLRGIYDAVMQNERNNVDTQLDGTDQ